MSSNKYSTYSRSTSFELSTDRSCNSRWSLYSGNSLSTDDEFNWSIQPNYLKMMNDTNLMDNCAAAKEDIESTRRQTMSCDFLATIETKRQRTNLNADQLLQWIVYMEKYLKAFSPDWKQVRKMDEMQRKASYNEQCELQRYIASHNRIVSQMIKDENSKWTRMVEGEYHKLLLKAIEQQCLIEGYLDDDTESRSITDVNLDVYKLCRIDNETPSPAVSSTESLSLNSDDQTIITSDDGVNFPTNPTTSKSSLFSDDHGSPFSSHPDYQNDEQPSVIEMVTEDIDREVEPLNNSKPSESSTIISESSQQLIQNAEQILPRSSESSMDKLLRSKVTDWLSRYPSELCERSRAKQAEAKALTLSSGSEVGSGCSIQWDSFQDIYKLTAPIDDCGDGDLQSSKDFLYFGDNYDEELNVRRNSSSGSSSSISDTRTTPSPPQQTLESDAVNNPTIVPQKLSCEKSIESPNVVASDLPEDVLKIIESLHKNYRRLKPEDFDGILKICRENVGCLVGVLNNNVHKSSESKTVLGDATLIDSQRDCCRCGVIARFVGSVVQFLYECGRSVRRSGMYRFLLTLLKRLYFMVKFFSRQVRRYRILYGYY